MIKVEIKSELLTYVADRIDLIKAGPRFRGRRRVLEELNNIQENFLHKAIELHAKEKIQNIL